MIYTRYPVQNGGVTTLDGMVGAITLVAGPGISIVDGSGTITISSTSSGDVTIGAFGSTPNANGLSINGSQVLNMQPADDTHPGGVSIASQTFGGSKTFSNLLNADGGIDRSTSGTLTIGATNSSTINIGNSGATVNIQGTTIYENTPHLLVADPLITVNSGGGAGSGQNSGIEVEEAGSITGYAETSSDRNSWILKAPNTAGVATVTPGASGFTINQGSHDPVTIGTANGLSLSTQALSLALSSTSTVGALSAVDWNTFNSKQASGNYITALTGDVAASGPGTAATTIQTNVVTNAKAAQMATLTIKGNDTGGTANASDLTVAQVNAILPVFTSTLNGLAPLSGGGSTNFLRADGTWAAPAGAGTVTSVAMTVPSILSISGSPITTSGTLALTYSGTALPILNGGTGQTTKAPAFDALSPMTTGGDLIYGGASGTGTRLANGSAGQFLKSNGTTLAPSWASPTITLTAPTVQSFTTGTSATYTTPANVLYLRVRLVGGGGGGGGSENGAGSPGTAGGNGGNTSFGTLTGNGGSGGGVSGSATQGGAGGSASNGDTNIAGGMGSSSLATSTEQVGGAGAGTYWGAGGGDIITTSVSVVGNPGAGYGSGGSGSGGIFSSGAGGGAGGFVEKLISSPAGTYTYSVGAAGTAGSAGTSGQAGGAGKVGYIIVEEYYQ